MNCERLEKLRRALAVLHGDNRRLPLATYRVMVALGEAGEPCSAYAVARRAGFLLEQGRVKLHEAKRFNVVEKVEECAQGVLWTLTDKGREELARVVDALEREEMPGDMPESAKKPARKRRKKEG